MLRWSGSAGVVAIAAAALPSCVSPTSSAAADVNGVVTLPGFTSRIIAKAGEKVGATGFDYRGFPDGAATFVDHEVPGGWYLTVNHEIPLIGGVSSIRFAPDGTIVDAFSICNDTSTNCAGGPTPWGTWLTCEEYEDGNVWECDPTGRVGAVRHRHMGSFFHEAAAVASDGNVYLTEDKGDGAFYRLVPDVAGDLSSGVLQVATGPTHDAPVTWKPVPRPNPTWDDPTRKQLSDTLRFSGGEGIATDGDTVWFTTKGDDRVWAYELASRSVSIRHQAGGSGLSGVDNLWFDRESSALFVAEDGGDMRVVLLRPDNSLVTVAHLPDQDLSEITGPCMSPDGQRLYFSSQRAPVGPLGVVLGVTYEITGPFDQLLGR